MQLGLSGRRVAEDCHQKRKALYMDDVRLFIGSLAVTGSQADLFGSHTLLLVLFVILQGIEQPSLFSSSIQSSATAKPCF